MKKTILSFLVLLNSTNTFALTEQIAFSQNYQPINKEYELSLLDEYFEEEKKLHLSNNKTNTEINKIINYKKQILKEYLNNYVEIKDDILPTNKKSPLIYLLKFQNQIGIDDLYNQQLIDFIKIKQKENGLNQTGILDPVTWFSVYQQPVNWQLSIIEKAATNWNSIIEQHSTNKNSKMIVVNIPSMQLFLYEKNKENNYDLLLKSNIVIGKPKTQTPLKNFDIISIKYNPTWTPTTNMLKRNLYENGELNVKWIKSHGLILYDEEGNIRDIEDIEDIKKPRFTQEPGSDNALGLLKFETNSKDAIYLHDTNEKKYFKYNTRSYSSGCIRVENYIELASLISNKSVENIQEYIDKEETHYKGLTRVPVYIDYSQVLFNEEGKATFYPDIYDKN